MGVGGMYDQLGQRIFALMSWALSPLFSRILLDTDDETQRVRKITFGTVAAMLLWVIPSHLVPTIVQGEKGHELYFIWCGWSLLTSIGVLAHLLVYKHASDNFVHVGLLMWTGVNLLVDLHSMTAISFNRGIVLMVIILDVVILSRVSPAFYLTVIALWLFLTEAELLLRYGLLDLPLTVPVSMRREAMCECDAPPCRTSISHFQRTSVIIFFVFVLDFWLTRRFARLAREEKEKVVAAVRTTHDIAQCFARFDLDRASEILSAAVELPADLSNALGMVLDNLHSYRPYLPAAFFVGNRDLADIDASVPGWNGAGVGMVFTDIRQSAALWEHDADAMKAALDLHDRLMRCAIAAHQGYEVKTIGDAFMVAFPTAVDAVRFGLDVQDRLAVAEWPERLSRGAKANDEYDTLMVRIGVHVGDVSITTNPATGRYDYYGSTVNKTARVEGLALPGGVTVTSDVLEAMQTGEGCAVLDDALRFMYPELKKVAGFAQCLQLATLCSSGPSRVYADLVRRLCREQKDKSETTIDSPSGSTPTESGLWQWRQPVSPFVHTRIGTACVVRLQSSRDLPTLGKCLAQASLSTVVGNFAVLSWGVQRTLPDHYCHGVAFLRALAAGLATTTFRAGIASGLINVSKVRVTAAQHFVAINGAPVDLSLMLCAGAAELGTQVLAASLERGAGVDVEDTLSPAQARPVDTWDYEIRPAQGAPRDEEYVPWTERDALEGSPSMDRHIVTVYDVQLAAAAEETASEYLSAWRRRDVQAMWTLAGDDRVLRRACHMFEEGQHLQHAHNLLAVDPSTPLHGDTFPMFVSNVRETLPPTEQLRRGSVPSPLLGSSRMSVVSLV